MSIEKWKKLALALSILIVLNVFFNVGVQTFYDEPTYEDFCDEFQSQLYDTPQSCEEAGGRWYREGAKAPPGSELRIAGYCDTDFTCWNDFDASLSVYNRNVFVVLTVLGAAMVVLSIYLIVPSAVLSGLMYGGLVSILIGVMRYWSDMDDYLRFVVSGAILFVLIVVGIKKVKD